MAFDIEQYAKNVENVTSSIEQRNMWAGSVRSLELIQSQVQNEIKEAYQQLSYWSKKARLDAEKLKENE